MPTRLCIQCQRPATYRGRCAEHARHTNRATHRHRSIYNSRRWKLTRRAVLFAQPLCLHCGDIATDVDHVTPIEDCVDPYDQANLQALCHSCHAIKTKQEMTVG